MRYLACLLAWFWLCVVSFAQGPAEPVDGAAYLVSWKRPDYPPELLQQKIEGEVAIEFVVTVEGHVAATKIVSSTDGRFEASARACVEAWTFEPAVSGGRKHESGLSVTVVFRMADAKARQQPLNPPIMPQALPVTRASVKQYAAPDYPADFARRQLTGTVTVRFTVTPEGKASRARVLAATSPELIRPALDALARSEFNPAKQGEARREADLVAPFEFSPIGFEKADVLAANRIRPATGDDWAGFTAPPRPVSVVEPVYPLDALVAGRAGTAEVALSVSNSGTVRSVKIRSASAPEFGEALAAAAAHWGFRPASNADGWTECEVLLAHDFVPRSEPSVLHPDIDRLVQAVSPGGPGVHAPTRLDSRLTPVWQVQPKQPEDFVAQGQPAEAVIDFIIDREGRARLPRVVRSTMPSVGWAAITAVSCWVFERPTQDGQPIDVRVAIPIKFPAP